MIEEELIKCRTFRTNEHQLANALGIKDYEAQSLLLQQLMESRLRKYSEDDIMNGIKNDDSRLMWQITYSRKDAYQRIKTQRQKEAQLKIKLRANISADYVINLDEPDKLDDKNKAKVIKLLPQLFREKSTRDFIELVLLLGKAETIAQMPLTERQFRKKLSAIERFCNEHRERFLNLVVSAEDERLINESATLNELEKFLSSEKYSDELFQSMINKHKSYLDNILGDYPDYPINPVQLLSNYKKQPAKEKYKLINCIADRLKEVNIKLDDTAQMRSQRV